MTSGQLVAWGAATELTAVEAMMWRAEADPHLRSLGVVLELLDRAPDWRRLLDAHAWALRRIPRLRHRVVDDPVHAGAPAWVESGVDLERHVRRVTLDGGATLADALAIAADFHMAGLERDRPLWQALLVEGLPDGTAAYLLKLHHALADGTAVVQLCDLLHSERPEPTPDKPELPPSPPVALTPAELAVRHLGHAAGRALPDALRLARYHAQHGTPVGDLPIALPVSLRGAGDAEGGNRFAGARIAGPAGPMSARERMRLVGERVRAARAEPALDFMGLSAGVASRLPVPVLTRLTASFTRSIAMQASNFRGLRRAAYIAGAKVERWFAFGPAPGCALMATLVSHGDRCCIGLTIDAASVADPDALMSSMRAGFRDVLAVA